VRLHYVRVGLLGQVGRFSSADATVFPRGTRVVCRTQRGLEIGEVVAHTPAGAVDGVMLRGATTEDELIAARLDRYRDEAYEACRKMLEERGISAVLMDVEHVFDGQSVYFYFLGETTPELESLTGELAQIYSAKVQFEQFVDTLTHGCGPGCGTEEAAGCGTTGGCGSCAVVDACGKKK
jgi:cell fate regulator YaaT (PSP1 superfamily)